MAIALLITLPSFKKHYADPDECVHGQTVYQCPMKCEKDKVYNKPGKCPICGMNLVEIKANNPAGDVQSKTNRQIKIIGAMKNVMMNGDLQPNIHLDTISNKEHLFGFGPGDRLRGEVIIIDGKSYLSTAMDNKTMSVTRTFDVKAPFFAYENIGSWQEIGFPDSTESLSQLEAFIDIMSHNNVRPFFFRIKATSKNSKIHVVNLPKGAKVNSPDDAHIGEQVYYVKEKPVELLGFFSTDHKAIFTHHDTFLHVHLITEDRQQMGHLDSLSLKKGTVKLFFPQYN